MSEQIKNGENFEIADGAVTVLNNISVAEKEEVKAEEVKEAIPKETEPQVSESVQKEEEPPIIPMPTQDDEPIIPAIDNVVPISTDIPVSTIQTPDVSPIPSTILPDTKIPGIDVADNNDTIIPTMDNVIPFRTPEVSQEQPFVNSFGYSQNSFDNGESNTYNNFDNSQDFYSQTYSSGNNISSIIEKPLNDIRDGYARLVEENNGLRSENNSLKAENDNLKSINQKLERTNAVMYNQVNNMKNKVLGMFGIPEDIQNSSNVFGQNNFNDNDLNNNGRNMAA